MICKTKVMFKCPLHARQQLKDLGSIMRLHVDLEWPGVFHSVWTENRLLEVG